MPDAAYSDALDHLSTTAGTILDADPRVQATGIARENDQIVYRAVRNVNHLLAQGTQIATPRVVSGIPVVSVNAPNDVMSMVELPASGPGSPGASSTGRYIKKSRRALPIEKFPAGYNGPENLDTKRGEYTLDQQP